MIPLFRPSHDHREAEAVGAVLKSRWTGLGPKTEEFEQKFAEYVGARYAVGVNSATSALHIALKLLDVGPGDEVIVPTLTFVSTAHVVKFCNATPVFVDINEDTLCMDYEGARREVFDETKAIIPVLYGGQPIEPWVQGDIAPLYDCAHACGSSFNAGGKLCTWSFHSVKNLSCGDGGMITTDNEAFWQRAKRLRWLGINKGTWDREKGGYSWDYNCEEIGFKYHMNDLMAAVGLVQLEKMPQMQAKRLELVQCYYRGLQSLEERGLLKRPPITRGSSWHLFYIRSKRRDELAAFLKTRDIATGVHYRPIHLYPCYGVNYHLPVAERVWLELLSLPLFPDLTLGEVDFICDSIKEFYART